MAQPHTREPHRSELYPGEKHCPLRAEPWSASRARAGIANLVQDSVEAFDASALWPTHPLDGDEAYGTSYYRGAGGVFWGVSFLGRQGLIELPPRWFSRELEALVQRSAGECAKYPKELDPTRSYLVGDIPLLMLLHVHQPTGLLCDQLFLRLQRASEGPVSELMWGLAGCMLATLHLHRATGQGRWLELYRTQADRLVAAGEEVEGVGYHWRPELYGQRHDGLGAVHGFAGNVVALLAGLPALSSEARSVLLQRVPEALVATAVQEGGRCNWPRSTSTERLFRVYHCHGAPGIVTSLAALPAGTSPALDALLLEAGELTYEAGPLRKGPSLCHGTAGNGFAFLKLYERTQDARWLERARQFAMHALWQVERGRELFSQGRYSLWTGDIGVALFVSECLQASARFPTIDVF
jgi:Lanthionine synthetase C-like protein